MNRTSATAYPRRTVSAGATAGAATGAPAEPCVDRQLTAASAHHTIDIILILPLLHQSALPTTYRQASGWWTFGDFSGRTAENAENAGTAGDFPAFSAFPAVRYLERLPVEVMNQASDSVPQLTDVKVDE